MLAWKIKSRLNHIAARNRSTHPRSFREGSAGISGRLFCREGSGVCLLFKHFVAFTLVTGSFAGAGAV